MSTNHSSGGCYCGNVTFEMTTTKPISDYQPRACDCDFCLKHGASYISDNKGQLAFKAQSASRFARYQHGSGIADFLICQNCGVLVGVTHGKTGDRFGAVNSRAIQSEKELPKPVSISPKQLPVDDRITRWKARWFPDVRVDIISA